MRGIEWQHGDNQVDWIAADAYRASALYERDIKEKSNQAGVSGLHDRTAAFGTGYILTDGQCKIPISWRPDVFVALQSAIAQTARAKIPDSYECHFGCDSKAKLKSQSLVPCWRGATLGSAICSKCHYRLVRELNDPSVPLVCEAD